MVARVARFEGVNFGAAEETMGEAETLVRPLLESLAGYAGHLQLASRDGEALAITFFDSEESAQAAEQVFDEEMPRTLGDLYKRWEGRRVAAGLYEVFADSRA